MKKYSGHLSFEEIKAACSKAGWSINHERYDAGSDYVTFGFKFGRTRRSVVYSTVSGGFIVDERGKMVTERSTDLDGTPWYDALLDFVYKPMPAAKAA